MCGHAVVLIFESAVLGRVSIHVTYKFLTALAAVFLLQLEYKQTVHNTKQASIHWSQMEYHTNIRVFCIDFKKTYSSAVNLLLHFYLRHILWLCWQAVPRELSPICGFTFQFHIFIKYLISSPKIYQVLIVGLSSV